MLLGLPATDRFLNGKIDQVRIFNTAISSSQVSTLAAESNSSSSISKTDIFNNGSGVALYGFNNLGNDTGGASGKIGASAHFNGSDSKITISNSSFLPQSNNSRSISCWINSNLDGINVGVLGYGTASTSQAFFIYLNGSAKLGIYAYYDNTDGTISVTANAWTHVVATYDGTDCKLYVNNVLDFTAAKTLNTGSGEFRMGGVNWNNSSEFFNGEIDQVRIFPTALTTDQVNALYTETAP